jgi:transposase
LRRAWLAWKLVEARIIHVTPHVKARLRGQMAELGLFVLPGVSKIKELAELIDSTPSTLLPDTAKACCRDTSTTDRRSAAGNRFHRTVGLPPLERDQPMALETIPGVSNITATAIAVTVADAKVSKSGRHFAARVGLKPRGPAARFIWARSPIRRKLTCAAFWSLGQLGLSAI